MVDTPADVSDPGERGVDLPDRSVTVDFSWVAYAYPGGPPVLRDLDVHIPAGQRVAVVGETGSGKSTTLAAMMDYKNDTEYGHILTIEDPIEFVHESKKCTVNQREVHRDTLGFNERNHRVENLVREASLDAYRGKVCLVVNVASKCGLTPQYEKLQALYEELGGDDFEILAFPSNDFMGQEPGSPEEIAAFCEKNYGVTFPMFEKVKVTGDDKDPVYQFLCRDQKEPDWNFTKYLVDRDGKVLHRFAPRTAPDDAELRKMIDDALAQ